MINCALIGNPNNGQEILFDKITKRQKYSDEEVSAKIDKKEGFISENTKLTVFPGLYSIDIDSSAEKIFNHYINTNKVDLIINVINSGNLERNLYLTMQLRKLNIPIVIILTKVYTSKNKGIYINSDILSEELELNIIETENFDKDTLIKIKSYIENNNFNKKKKFDIKLIEEKNTYKYIEETLNCCVIKKESTHVNITEKLDKILLNKFLAYPIFLLTIYILFKIVFSWVGTPLSELFREALFKYTIPYLDKLLYSSSEWFRSLLIDGVISGISSVLVFLPVILTLFIFLSFIEDSGYINRVAFLMDKIMNLGGLSGKAFMPMIIGFGCSVPAIISAKNIENKKERKIAALLIPLMSCNAKLPVYMLFATIFFHDREIVIIAFMYSIGILIAFISSFLFKCVLKEREYEVYMDELPEYTMPEISILISHTWEKGKGFLKKIGTIIFSMSVITWLLSNFNFRGMSNIDNSFLSILGKFISPIFIPLGFGNWQNSVSLLTGLMGKEVIAGTLGVLYGGNLSETMNAHFSTPSALSFLVFILLYTPCLSTLITMKKEFGNKMMLFCLIYQFVIAWIISFIVFNLSKIEILNL